jgi:hypothetical protein
VKICVEDEDNDGKGHCKKTTCCIALNFLYIYKDIMSWSGRVE